MELENFLLKIGRPRTGTRRLESPETEAARAFGGRLYDAVFASDVGMQWARSVDAAERDNRGLRLRLRLSEAPQLADLPWEYLYSPTSDDFVVLSSWTPVVRYISLDKGAPPLQVAPPLRMLAMVSSPTDYPPLDVEAEWARLDEGLAEIVDAGLVEIHRMENATLRELQRALRRQDYHLFHFIGHGGFDVAADDGVLMLETAEGRAREVSGRQLGTILDDARTIRLAVLNACEGARASGTDPFAGVAQSLVARGIPAVVAMQFEITDRAAIVFAHEFYTAITDGMAIEGAVGEARRAIFGSKSDVEWGTAVLYMRAEDGRLFDMKALPEPTLVMETPTVVMEEDIPVVVTPDELPTVEIQPPVAETVAEAEPPLPVVEPPVVEVDPAPVAPPRPEPVVEPSPTVAGFGAKYGRMAGIGLLAAVVLIVLGINAFGGNEPGTTLGPIVEQQIVDSDLVIATPTTDVVIDGDLSEWAALPTAYRLQHPVTNNLSDDRLGNDSIGTLWTAFDGAALYVAVDVVDDVYSQANEGNQIWRGDALNINLFSNAFNEVPARPDPLTFQLTMTPLSQVTGSAGVVLFVGNGDGFADNTTDLPITIAGGETAQGWRLEARVPWSVFKMDGPPPRQLDAALFAVFDNDGETVGDVPVQAAILTNLPDAGFQDPQTWGSFNVE
ncbi:MAG: CHAT domain-containing protein [Acidimicrobiales bacterium]